jgi:hypothetical protein
MGQSVRSMAKVGDAAAIEADKNGHKKDQDGDVTQFLFGQNSDNSSTAVPLPSDELSMSSIVDTQANNIQTDNTANDLGKALVFISSSSSFSFLFIFYFISIYTFLLILVTLHSSSPPLFYFIHHERLLTHSSLIKPN